MKITGAVALKPATDTDQPFLYRVFASTRAEELAPLGWDEATTDAFLRLQYDAQDRAYRQSHPSASFDLVMLDGRAAGRIYVDRRPGSIHVLDIALLPEHRGRGIGTALLRTLLGEAAEQGKRVTLNVLRSNPALGLYRRLGFELKRVDEVYADLEWRPPVAPDQVNTAS